MARPEKWNDEYVRIAGAAAKLGATDRDVGEMLGVCERTIHYWKHEHADFAEALKVGKEAADERVVQSLYRRALGYSHDAVKIMMADGVPIVEPFVEHYPPDTTAAIFWLKNRRPGEWRDKSEVANTHALDAETAAWLGQTKPS